MEGYQCEYCSNTFTTKPNLYKHQKNAKYCLNLRTDSKIQCEYCNSQFATNKTLKQHYSLCENYYKGKLENKLEKARLQLQETIKNYEERIKRYEEQLKLANQTIERLASRAIDRPTNTRNNTINNVTLTPLTTEHIQQYLPQLTREHIDAGSAGYARFAVEYPLKDTLVCVDKARKKWRFKNEDGEIVDDHEGQIVTEKFFQAICDRNQEIIKDYTDELMALSQQAGDTAAMVEIYRKITELNDIDFNCNDIVSGKETEFKKGFVNDVTKILGRIKSLI